MSVAPAGQPQTTFSVSSGDLTAQQQLKLARLSGHLARGCRVDVWIIEPDVGFSARLPARGGQPDAAYWEKALALFVELHVRLGLEVPLLEALSRLDVAILKAAKRYLDRGTADYPGRGGVITMRTDTDLREAVPAASIKNGTVRLSNAQPEFMLPLSRHPFSIGPAMLSYVAHWPPEVREEDGVFVSTIRLDAKRPVRLISPRMTPR